VKTSVQQPKLQACLLDLRSRKTMSRSLGNAGSTMRQCRQYNEVFVNRFECCQQLCISRVPLCFLAWTCGAPRGSLEMKTCTHVKQVHACCLSTITLGCLQKLVVEDPVGSSVLFPTLVECIGASYLVWSPATCLLNSAWHAVLAATNCVVRDGCVCVAFQHYESPAVQSSQAAARSSTSCTAAAVACSSLTVEVNSVQFNIVIEEKFRAALLLLTKHSLLTLSMRCT